MRATWTSSARLSTDQPCQAPTSHAREVSLGIRPKCEPELVAPGQLQCGDIAGLDAFIFKRYLDRVFWHPLPEVLRFEVRAIPSSGECL